jgi:peroxiredoxin
MLKQTLCLFLFIFAFFVSPILADDPVKVENFTLNDVNGKAHSLADYKNSKAIVVMFIATQCPISNDYNNRMAKIYESYKGKDIAFLGINSNVQEDIEEIKEHSKKNKFNFPVLKDEGNIIADKFNASVTPEIYILDSNFEILYHGRIDDSRKGDNIRNDDLKTALAEILEGKEVSNKRTKAFGCTIKRVKS